ncbi:MAG: putative quinol monooxygenase [Acidimicrobiales bacterium]
MIIISAEFELADASDMGNAMDVAVPLQQSTRDDEPGCIAYVFGPDPCVPERIQVFEVWEDEASLAAHFQHDNYRNMAAGLATVGLAGATSAKYRVTARERVYDEGHTARAYFFDSEVQAPDEAIVIGGTFDANDPGLRDETLQKSIPFQMATRTDEPGCRAYAFYADPCIEGRIQVYELWDNQAALAPHFEHENYFNMGGLLRGVGGTSDHYKYRCDVIEPVYDETRTPRADFFAAG